MRTMNSVSLMVRLLGTSEDPQSLLFKHGQETAMGGYSALVREEGEF